MIELTFWHWWILCAVLFALEMMAPTSYLLWPALAAGVVGFVALVAPGLDPYLQIFIYAVLSVIALFVGIKYFKTRKTTSDAPNLNKRPQQFEGKKFTLNEALQDGRGSVTIGDTRWIVQSTDGESYAAGDKIVITGADGVTLLIGRA